MAGFRKNFLQIAANMYLLKATLGSKVNKPVVLQGQVLGSLADSDQDPGRSTIASSQVKDHDFIHVYYGSGWAKLPKPSGHFTNRSHRDQVL